MFKYIIPFLLFVSSANAEPHEQISKPNNYETSTVEKCNTTDVRTVIRELKVDYKAMIYLADKLDVKITHEIAYDMQNDRIITLSIDYSDNEKTNPVRICINFIGTTPYGVGETFKDFVLHQTINDNQIILDKREKLKQEYRKKKEEE
jgi:hypothetical protein